MTGQRAVYPSLAGRSGFVTGGANGIGAAIVADFARQNARVTFVDVDEGAATNLIAGIREAGHAVPHFIACDITDTDALKAAITETGDRHGPISVLVNNAANDDRHDFEDVTPEYWIARLDLLLRPMFFAAQAVVPQMREAGGGSIINFCSISWMTKMDNMPAYTTAKSAVHGLVKSLASKLGPDRIRVNAVVPGWVMTDRQKALWLDDEGESTMDQMQCLPGRLQPDDLSAMVMFLASDDSAMCTAQDFIVDAGWS